MTTKKHKKSRLQASHFLIIFWATTALLAIVRHFIFSTPEPAEEEVAAVSVVAPDPTRAELSESRASAEQDDDDAEDTYTAIDNMPDSIAQAHSIVERIFHSPRTFIALLDADGNPLRNKTRKINYSEAFNDLQDVQFNTATVIGAPECTDRADAVAHNDRYVYVGASPFYDIEHLTYSVPYLVPHAAVLLDEIGRAFMDSLTSKGIPFHKMVVTSLLRTSADVEQLTRRNHNATEQSCHMYGTTFDIAYTSFHRVSDPEGPKQQEWSAMELMPILAEVLDDQHQLGTCYIKHEVRKHCFHITCR